MSDRPTKDSSVSEVLAGIQKILRDNVEKWGTSLAYDGFDPAAFREMILAKWSYELITKALCTAIIRGNNIKKMQDRGTSKDGKAIIDELVTEGVVFKRKNGKTITLARMAAAFPLETIVTAFQLDKAKRMRYLLSDEEMKECVAKVTTDPKPPKIIFVLGLASVIPGQWSSAYMLFSEKCSALFNATDTVKKNTKRLIAQIGGNFKVGNLESAKNTFKTLKLGYPETNDATAWDKLKKANATSNNNNTAETEEKEETESGKAEVADLDFT